MRMQDPLPRWLELYEKLAEELRLSADHILKLGREERLKVLRATDELREEFVLWVVGSEAVDEAREWIGHLVEQLEDTRRVLGLRGVTLTRELGSFMRDPLAHLKKKIFNYTFQLLSGAMSATEFASKAAAAVRTSLRTNMRTLYQTWVFLALVKMIGDGGRVIYPEHRYLYLERNARQRTGMIPPNCILRSADGRVLSFFVEAPRPIAWEDTSDLERAWKFYVALRPDFLVYGGVVMDIVNLSGSPPIRRPNVIIECKELEDWYRRARDLRGWWSKAMSAEEWRALWLRGLIEGLAEVVGVKPRSAPKAKGERKALRVREYKLVQIYKRVYSPDSMILVARAELPSEIRAEMEAYGLSVYDGVGFDEGALREVAEEVLRHGRAEPLSLRDAVERALRGAEVDEEVVERAIAALVERHRDEFVKLVRELSEAGRASSRG